MFLLKFFTVVVPHSVGTEEVLTTVLAAKAADSVTLKERTLAVSVDSVFVADSERMVFLQPTQVVRVVMASTAITVRMMLFIFIFSLGIRIRHEIGDVRNLCKFLEEKYLKYFHSKFTRCILTR